MAKSQTKIYESPKQQVSVCRMVHFHPEAEGPAGPHAAVVAAVHDAKAQAVTLVVFHPEHGSCLHQDVPYSQKPKPGHWTWPDYAPHVPNHVVAEIEAEAVAAQVGAEVAPEVFAEAGSIEERVFTEEAPAPAEASHE